MVNADFQLAAARAAVYGEVLPLGVAPEDRVGDAVGIRGDTFKSVDEEADARPFAARTECTGVGDVIKARRRRTRAIGPAIDQDVAAAIVIIDFM